MISDAEVATSAGRFGVADDQVRRDHLVSHVLNVLPTAGDLRFFGGTALTRTHLDGRRMSEDIDLLVDDHRQVAGQLAVELPRGLRREFPRVTWAERRRDGRVIAAVVEAPDVPMVGVQVVRAEPPERRLEYERRAVALRYSDLPETTELVVPTLTTFAAMKLSAWQDRKAPRDLFDLHGLVGTGAIDTRAVAAFRTLLGTRPAMVEFERLPSGFDATWRAELGHQTGELPDPEACLTAVRDALGAAPGAA